MILAQFNIGRARYPISDPRMKDFVDNVERVNAIANRMEGFIWRLQDESGHAMNIRAYPDPMILPNLTLWKNEDRLRAFVFGTVHKKFIQRADEWFETVDGPKNVMWWVRDDHRPGMAEGVERLAYLKVRGDSDYAFSFRSPRGIVPK